MAMKQYVPMFEQFLWEQKEGKGSVKSQGGDSFKNTGNESHGNLLIGSHRKTRKGKKIPEKAKKAITGLPVIKRGGDNTFEYIGKYRWIVLNEIFLTSDPNFQEKVAKVLENFKTMVDNLSEEWASDTEDHVLDGKSMFYVEIDPVEYITKINLNAKPTLPGMPVLKFFNQDLPLRPLPVVEPLKVKTEERERINYSNITINNVIPICKNGLLYDAAANVHFSNLSTDRGCISHEPIVIDRTGKITKNPGRHNLTILNLSSRLKLDTNSNMYKIGGDAMRIALNYLRSMNDFMQFKNFVFNLHSSLKSPDIHRKDLHNALCALTGKEFYIKRDTDTAPSKKSEVTVIKETVTVIDPQERARYDSQIQEYSNIKLDNYFRTMANTKDDEEFAYQICGEFSIDFDDYEKLINLFDREAFLKPDEELDNSTQEKYKQMFIKQISKYDGYVHNTVLKGMDALKTILNYRKEYKRGIFHKLEMETKERYRNQNDQQR